MLQLALSRRGLTSGVLHHQTARRQSCRVRFFKDDDEKRSVWADIPTKANYSIQDKEQVLQRAEAELSAFCSNLPDDHEARRCWESFDYLRKKHTSYLAGCTIEVSSGKPADNCNHLEELDQMVRELESTGSVENVYHVLDIMKRIEDSSPADGHAQHRAPAPDVEEQQLLNNALNLFEKMDTNHDGRIDAAEFEAAMKFMSNELADELPVIFECLDVHGFVDKEQFVDIILAEKTRLQNPDSDAEFLKHVSHYHPKRQM